MALLPVLANGNSLTPYTEQDIVCREELAIVRYFGRQNIPVGAWICGKHLVIRLRTLFASDPLHRDREEIRTQVLALLRIVDPVRTKAGLIDVKWDEEDSQNPLEPHAA